MGPTTASHQSASTRQAHMVPLSPPAVHPDLLPGLVLPHQATLVEVYTAEFRQRRRSPGTLVMVGLTQVAPMHSPVLRLDPRCKHGSNVRGGTKRAHKIAYAYQLSPSSQFSSAFPGTIICPNMLSSFCWFICGLYVLQKLRGKIHARLVCCCSIISISFPDGDRLDLPLSNVQPFRLRLKTKLAAVPRLLNQ